ncbi:MAG: glycosyltransferase family 4 protein [Phycisphaerales bacterium]|nr:glycosyltransferase family 4 protein [Phycisphaerales bacterium]
MRIGILTLDWPPHGGGMSRFCCETFAELAKRGHTVTALSWHRAQSSVEGIRVEPILNGDLSTDRSALRRFDGDVDLWHAWEFGYGGLAHLTSRPMIVTVHGNDLMRPKAYYRFTRTPALHRLAPRLSKPRWQARLCKPGLKRVTCFTPNSSNTEKLLRRSWPNCRRIEVVPCGVGDQFFQRHERHDGPPRLLTVCSLSTLRRRKNVTGVIKALARLRHEFAFRYDVCGDGDMIDELRDFVTRLEMEDRVCLHGSVEDERLAEFYRAADLFVLAPYEREDDVEGFGIVYLEANAAGTPCLAVRTGGIEDAVRDGISGFFAASPEPADLADALRRFLSGKVRLDPDAARDWAGQHRYPNIVDRLEAVYQSLLA